jgi:hypothetical protein
VIEREFQDTKGTKTTGSSHGYFCFVVQVSSARCRLHGLLAPEIQEHARLGGRVVFSELLKIFLEQIGTDGLDCSGADLADGTSVAK